MAPIFILTRAVAISAILIGAFPTVWSAPILLQPRYLGACRYGCLFADGPESSAAVPSATAAVIPVQNVVPTIIEVIQAASPPPATVSQLVSTTDTEVATNLPNVLSRPGSTEPMDSTSPVPSVVEVIDLNVPTADNDKLLSLNG